MTLAYHIYSEISSLTPAPFLLTLTLLFNHMGLLCYQPARRVAECTPPPTKHDRICQPIIYCIGILSCRHLKNSECRKRLSLNLPYVPRDRSSKKSSLIKNPLLGRFITGVETTGQHYSQRSFVTNSRTSHLSFSKILFTFPKNQ